MSLYPRFILRVIEEFPSCVYFSARFHFLIVTVLRQRDAELGGVYVVGLVAMFSRSLTTEFRTVIRHYYALKTVANYFTGIQVDLVTYAEFQCCAPEAAVLIVVSVIHCALLDSVLSVLTPLITSTVLYCSLQPS